MKTSSYRFLAGLIALASCIVVRPAEAATNASDAASNYTSATWTTGSNQGTGFGAWNLFGSTGNANSGGFYGNYVGGTGLGANTFGIYSGPANSNASFDAQRPLTGGALTAGQVFSVDLGHSTIQSGGTVGINFQNSVGSNVFSLIANGTNFLVNDGGSNFSVAPDTANTDYKFTFTYNGNNNYSFTITDVAAGSTVGSGTGYNASSDITDISRLQFFDFQQGSGQNFGFDNLSVVPEPGTWFAGFLTVGAAAWRLRRRARPGVA